MKMGLDMLFVLLTVIAGLYLVFREIKKALIDRIYRKKKKLPINNTMTDDRNKTEHISQEKTVQAAKIKTLADERTKSLDKAVMSQTIEKKEPDPDPIKNPGTDNEIKTEHISREKNTQTQKIDTHVDECNTNQDKQVISPTIAKKKTALNSFDIVESVLIKYRGHEVHVRVPDGVKMIGKGAFRSTNIHTVYLPNGLQCIGEQAFAFCKRMYQVNIPSSVTKIGKDAFKGAFSYYYSPKNELKRYVLS